MGGIAPTDGMAAPIVISACVGKVSSVAGGGFHPPLALSASASHPAFHLWTSAPAQPWLRRRWRIASREERGHQYRAPRMSRREKDAHGSWCPPVCGPQSAETLGRETMLRRSDRAAISW